MFKRPVKRAEYCSVSDCLTASTGVKICMADRPRRFLYDRENDCSTRTDSGFRSGPHNLLDDCFSLSASTDFRTLSDTTVTSAPVSV